MAKAITLPKVASYVKNVGKSVKLAAIDYLGDSMPSVSEFLDTNADLFKEIYSSTTNYRETFKKTTNSIKNSKVYEAYDAVKKSLFEDLKTGNWYNAEREQALAMRGMGLDFDDPEFDDFGFEDSNSDAAKQSKAFDMAIEASTKAQAAITIKSADMVASTVKSSNTALFMQNEKLMASMTAGMGSIHAAVSGVGKYLEGPMMAHLQNTKIYQEESLKQLSTISAQMDELLKMQRNLYATTAETLKSDDISNVVGYEGTPDLRAYGKQIYKNFKSMLGPEVDMMLGDTFGKGSNMLLALVGSPLKVIPDLLVKTIVPTTVKRVSETLDKSISGIFTTLVSRFNDMSDHENPVLSTLGRLLGIDINRKNKFATDKFKKGPIPFDGATKQAIVEVIPAHLRRIEAALTGVPERIYDMRTGKWTNIRNVEKEYKERQDNAVKMSFSEITEIIKRLIKTKDADQAKAIAEAYEKIQNKVYEEKGNFRGYRSKKSALGNKTPWEYYGVDKATYLEIMRALSESPDGRNAVMNLSRNTIRQIQSWNSYLAEAEISNSPINQLFNKAYNIDIGFSSKYDSKSTNYGVKHKNFLTASTDNHGKDIFFYLQGIYGLLLARGSTGGGGKKYGRHISPEEALNRAIKRSTPLDIEEEQVAANRSAMDVIGEDMFIRAAEERAAKEEALNREPFYKQFKSAKTLGEKYKAIQNSAHALLTRPSEILIGLMEKADSRIYQVLFGKEDMEKIEKTYGKQPGGIAEHMVYKLNETFDKLNDWLEDHVFAKVKDWLDQMGITKKFKDIKEKVAPALRKKFSGFIGGVKGAFSGIRNDTIGAYRKATKARWSDEDDENYDTDSILSWQGLNAAGKYITKRGLAIVSPGEVIIPATRNKKGQRRQLFKEKAFARRFGIKNADYFATGTLERPTDTDSETGYAEYTSTRDSKKIFETVRKVAHEISPSSSIVDIAIDSLIGGGVSLLTGIIGGPLLGAAAGAGFGIVKNSKSVQNFLFGSETTDDEGNVTEKKGLISKNFQEKFKKYFPDMKNYGIIGGVTGLITPLGLVGGLMTGGALGFLKNNDTFQDWLFGKKDEKTNERDGGLISKAFREKVKKAAPRMAVGAVGGALLGPFGLLGNAALGSALGFVTTTDTFSDFVFGKDDGTGKRKGGIVGALKEGMVEPLIKWGKDLAKEGKEFFNEKILKPLQDFVEPMTQMIKNAITGISDRVKEGFDRKVVTPISDFLHHKVLEPIGKALGKLIRAPIALAKGIVSAPFSLLGFMGNNARASQIARGTATNMTAAERVAWRKQHQGRRFGNNAIGRTEFHALDTLLTSDNFAGVEGLNKMKEMRDNMSLYLDSKKKVGAKVAKLEQDLINSISEILNTSTMQDERGNTTTAYSYVGYKSVKRINDCIAKGNIDEALKELSSGRFKNVPTAIKAQVSDIINKMAPTITEAIDRMKSAKSVSQAFEAKFGKITGLKSTSEYRRFSRILDKEISEREKVESTEESIESPIQDQTKEMQNFLDKKTNNIIEVLRSIRKAIYNLADSDDVDDGIELSETDKAAKDINIPIKQQFEEKVSDITGSITGGIGKAKRGLGRFLRTGKTRISGAMRTAKQTAIDGFNDARNLGYEASATYYQGLVGSGVKEIGGMLVGSKNKIASLVNRGYRLVTKNGKTAVSDAAGNILKTKGSKEYLKAEEEENLTQRKASEALADISKGVIGTVTGLFGSAWQKAKETKNNIGEWINNALENSVIGKVVKGIFGIGKVALGISLTGHFAEFWTESVWNPILKPFWNDKLKPMLGNIGNKISEFIQEHFPKLSNLFEELKGKFEGFFENPLGKIKDFFIDGLKKFWDYVEVPLYNLLYNAFNKVSVADFTAKRTAEKLQYQATDENGNLLYIDADGNTTTTNTGTAKMTTSNVKTETYKNNFWNTITNDGVKTRKEAKNSAGLSFIYTEYYSGAVAVQNVDTGAWISLNDGIGSKTVNVGWRVDNNGKPLVKDAGISLSAIVPSTIITTVIGYIGGGVIGTALGAKIGSAIGTAVLPGLGTIIGALLGVAVGAGVSIVLYQINKDNGVAVEEEGIDCNSGDGIRLLQSFGIGNGSWPSFPVNTGSVTGTPVDTTGYTSTAVTTKYNTNDIISSNYTEAESGSRRSGRAHIYQKAKDIANRRFGNSTIGEAGCGPVAATNLINKMGGSMDIGTAAAYAENGGFIDRSTGGATTSYINSILNDSGIAATETTNKNAIYNSLKRGNPVVMLGNSGTEHNTPFGASDHYITAMGLDRNGNIIAEDPDLPDSYRKYKASRVMRDVDVGIATGMSRLMHKSGKNRHRIRSGRSKDFALAELGAGSISSSSGTKISDWSFRCAECIAQVESINAGGYAAVNANDVGSMSVGRYQYRASRAIILLYNIVRDLVADGIFTTSTIRELLGKDLYDYIMGTSGNTFIPTNNQVKALRQILSTEQGMNAQDRNMITDIYTYYVPITDSLGIKPATQENIVIYCHSIIHNAGTGAGKTICKRILDAAKASTGKAISKLELADVHAAALIDEKYGSKHKSRLETQYAYLSGTKTVGTGYSYYDANEYHSTMTQVEKSTGNLGILSALGDAIKSVMTRMYGSSLMSMFGISSDVESEGYANTNLEGSGTYIPTNSPNAQKALVEWMKSKQGKLKYSTSAPQDPESGQSSCANTVYWAYRKALGLPNRDNGIASNFMADPNFEYIYKSPIMTFNESNPRYSQNKNIAGNYNEAVMQPGDIIYYRTRNNGYGTEPLYGGGHVEMYMGDGKRIGHGGDPLYGPTVKSLASNANNIIGVKRYVPFIEGKVVPYTNTTGTTDSSVSTPVDTSRSNLPLPTKKNFNSSTVALSGNGRDAGINIKGRRKAFAGAKYSNATRQLLLEHNGTTTIPSGASATARSGMAAVSYEDFLGVIIELLTIIAKNSDKMNDLIALLAKNNVKVDPSDVANAGNSRSAQNRLAEAIRSSGLGRSKNVHNSSSGTEDTNSADIQYIVGLMESLARS